MAFVKYANSDNIESRRLLIAAGRYLLLMRPNGTAAILEGRRLKAFGLAIGFRVDIVVVCRGPGDFAMTT